MADHKEIVSRVAACESACHMGTASLGICVGFWELVQGVEGLVGGVNEGQGLLQLLRRLESGQTSGKEPCTAAYTLLRGLR